MSLLTHIWVRPILRCSDTHSSSVWAPRLGHGYGDVAFGPMHSDSCYKAIDFFDVGDLFLLAAFAFAGIGTGKNYYLELRTPMSCICVVHLQLQKIAMKEVMIDEHHAAIDSHVIDDISKG